MTVKSETKRLLITILNFALVGINLVIEWLNGSNGVTAVENASVVSSVVLATVCAVV